MNGLKSAVGAVMMVTVMAGTVEVIAQDQSVKVVGAGETVSVQAPKQHSKYGYFRDLVVTNGSSSLMWQTHRFGETEIGKADVPQQLPVADQDAVAKAAGQLKSGDPIEVVITGRGVIDIKKISLDAVMAAMREEQRQYNERLKESRSKRQENIQGGQGLRKIGQGGQ